MFLFLISNDRALHSVGAAMEKANAPYIFKLCKTELKEGAWMISIVDVIECRMWEHCVLPGGQ